MEVILISPEDDILLDKTRVKIIPSISEPVENSKKKWKKGSFLITKKEVKLIPDEGESFSINLSDITDVGKKLKLGKLALGAARIIVINHTTNNEKLVSLVSTTNIENEISYKKILLKGVINNSNIEFVSPFSKGGKILFDKQPVKGTIELKENNICLSSEWLGQKQNEEIDIIDMDDFEKSIDEPKKASITLKYQKDGIVISTLISSNATFINLLEKYIKILKGITDNDEELDLDEKEFMLLQMMYSSDIDAEDAMELLNVDFKALENIVRMLVKYKLLAVSEDDEFILTEKGTKYIVSQMKKNIQNA